MHLNFLQKETHMKTIYAILFLTLILSVNFYAQEKTVGNRVVDTLTSVVDTAGAGGCRLPYDQFDHSDA